MKKGVVIAKVVQDTISFEEVSRWKSQAGHGALNVFVGMVREFNQGRKVVSIEYDCFIPLCERTLSQIANEAQEKWGHDTEVLVIHRHGLLKVGEPSVLVLATSKHRDESYRITRFIIEEIKIRAPIWKKENYIDGESEWVQGHALCQHRKVDHHEIVGSHSCGGKVHTHGPG